MDATDWDTRYAASESVWSLGPNAYVQRRAQDLTPGEAVDVACGEGRNAVWLATLGWQVHATDFSTVAVERMSFRAAAAGVRVHGEVADVMSWLPEEASTDLVVVSYLQVPAAQLGAVLQAAATALRPGGKLLAVGHDVDNLAHGVGGPSDPEVLWSAETLRQVEGIDWQECGQWQRQAPADDRHPAGTAIDTVGWGTKER